MAKPKKIFTQKEMYWLRDYIDRKFKLDLYWPTDDGDVQNKAQRSFEEIRNDLDPEKWGAWCVQWLDDSQWQALLVTLRVKSKRNSEAVSKKNITLDREAWLYLSTLANRYNVTISQFLISRLEQEYMEKEPSA